MLRKKANLFGRELIAVDGSKFAAVNSNKNAHTKDKLKKKLDNIEKHIQAYFDELDKNDEEES